MKDRARGLGELKNRSEKCEGPGWGGDQRLFEKIKVFLKNQKHEPNIVEITHMCIMHMVHTSIYIYRLPNGGSCSTYMSQ